MLAKSLLTVRPRPIYVGGVTASASSLAGITLAINSLVGGEDSAPDEGDIVVVGIVVARNTSGAITAPTGYTEVNTLTADQGTDDTVNTWIGYKFMGSTPDASVSIPAASGATNCSMCVAAMAFRKIRSVDDLNIEEAVIGGTSEPSTPSFTPQGVGVILCLLGATHTSGVLTYADDGNGPDAWDVVISKGHDATANDGSIAMAYIQNDFSQQYFPADLEHGGFTGGGQAAALTLIHLQA